MDSYCRFAVMINADDDDVLYNKRHEHCCFVIVLVWCYVPTFKLSVTLSNLNGFSKFLHSWKAYKICYETHLTLRMLLHYLGKLKSQILVDI